MGKILEARFRVLQAEKVQQSLRRLKGPSYRQRLNELLTLAMTSRKDDGRQARNLLFAEFGMVVTLATKGAR